MSNASSKAEATSLPAPIQWHAPAVFNGQEMDPASFSVTPAPSGSGLSIVFGDLQLTSIDTDWNWTASQVRLGSLAVPVSVAENMTFRGYLTHIRLTVEKDPGARIVVIADVGGATEVIEFPYGDEITQATEFRRDVFSLEKLSVKGSAPEPPPMRYYIASLFLSIQPRAGRPDVGPTGNAFVRLHSLDIVPVFV